MSKIPRPKVVVPARYPRTAANVRAELASRRVAMERRASKFKEIRTQAQAIAEGRQTDADWAAFRAMLDSDKMRRWAGKAVAKMGNRHPYWYRDRPRRKRKKAK